MTAFSKFVELKREHFLELLDFVASCESGKGFVVVPALQVNLEHSLAQFGNFGKRNSFEHVFPDGGVRSKAASEGDVIALDGLAADADFDRLEADVADIMLRARMRAASEVDVQGMVQANSFVQVGCKRQSISFRIGGGVFAPGV